MVEKFEVGKKYVYPFPDSQDKDLWSGIANPEMGKILDGHPHLCASTSSVDSKGRQRARFEDMENSWAWDVKNFVLYIPKIKRKYNMLIIKNEYDKEKDALKVEIIKTKTATKLVKSMAIMSQTTEYFCEFTQGERKRYRVRNMLAGKLNDYNTFMFDVEYIEQEKIVLHLSDYDKVDYLKDKLDSLFSAISNTKILFTRKEVTRVVEVIPDEKA